MEKRSSDLSIKLLEGKQPTAGNIKRLADEINQAFLVPRQPFPPLENCHVDTIGFNPPAISLELCYKSLSSIAVSKVGVPDDIPN